jgi:hypothetical protein
MRTHLILLPLLITACSETGLNLKSDDPLPRLDRSESEEGDEDTAFGDTGAGDTAEPEKDPEPEPEPDPEPEEICDGEDNDGDGQVDEGFAADSDGIADCREQAYDLNLLATGDDVLEVWVDGHSLGSEGAWNQSNEFHYTVDSGPHVIAVQVEDRGEVIVGFLAELRIDGGLHSRTGSGDWLSKGQQPQSGWQDTAFNDVHWHAARPCEDISPWGDDPQDLTQVGAQWIWPYADCRQIGTGWFRLRLDLP